MWSNSYGKHICWPLLYLSGALCQLVTPLFSAIHSYIQAQTFHEHCIWTLADLNISVKQQPRHLHPHQNNWKMVIRISVVSNSSVEICNWKKVNLCSVPSFESRDTLCIKIYRCLCLERCELILRWIKLVTSTRVRPLSHRLLLESASWGLKFQWLSEWIGFPACQLPMPNTILCNANSSKQSAQLQRADCVYLLLSSVLFVDLVFVFFCLCVRICLSLKCFPCIDWRVGIWKSMSCLS